MKEYIKKHEIECWQNHEKEKFKQNCNNNLSIKKKLNNFLAKKKGKMVTTTKFLM